jgi:hypothetical protein
MNRRPASLGLAAVLIVLLAGCTTPRQPPPGATAEETAALLEMRVDQAWLNTGLEGVAERPAVERVDEPANFDELAECLSDAGLVDWGMSDGSTGPGLAVSRTPSADEQLIFYTCFAQHPTDVIMGGVRLSRAQLDYLYDYYRSWVIPCLALDSITVPDAPTRQEFAAEAWHGWNPYRQAPGIVTEQEYRDAIERCGPVYADLDVVDPFDQGPVGFGGSTTTVQTIEFDAAGA